MRAVVVGQKPGELARTVSKPGFTQNPLNGLGNPVWRSTAIDANTGTMRHDASSVIWLICAERDADEWDGGTQCFRHRAEPALGHHRRHVRQNRLVGHVRFNLSVWWGIEIRRIERWAERHQCTYRKARKRVEDSIHDRSLPLVQRAQTHEYERKRIIVWPWEFPRSNVA